MPLTCALDVCPGDLIGITVIVSTNRSCTSGNVVSRVERVALYLQVSGKSRDVIQESKVQQDISENLKRENQLREEREKKRDEARKQEQQGIQKGIE